MPEPATTNGAKPAAAPGVPAAGPGVTAARIRDTVERAERGDEAAVPALRQMLAAAGSADRLGGNLADLAAAALLSTFAGRDLYLREVVAKKMGELRAELAGPDPPAVERLLAERAACCWLHLYALEHALGSKPALAADVALYYQRAINGAHRRYLSSLKALADVRKANVSIRLKIGRLQTVVAPSAIPAG